MWQFLIDIKHFHLAHFLMDLLGPSLWLRRTPAQQRPLRAVQVDDFSRHADLVLEEDELRLAPLYSIVAWSGLLLRLVGSNYNSTLPWELLGRRFLPLSQLLFLHHGFGRRLLVGYYGPSWTSEMASQPRSRGHPQPALKAVSNYLLAFHATSSGIAHSGLLFVCSSQQHQPSQIQTPPTHWCLDSHQSWKPLKHRVEICCPPNSNHLYVGAEYLKMHTSYRWDHWRWATKKDKSFLLGQARPSRGSPRCQQSHLEQICHRGYVQCLRLLLVGTA